MSPSADSVLQRRTDGSFVVAWFITELLVTLVFSVAIGPLLPVIIVPQVVTLFVVMNAMKGNMTMAIRWAVWGGLCLDLLSPSHFGYIWLPMLVVALLLFLVRRLVSVDLPGLWVVWFALAAFVAALPLALLTASWPILGASVFATTVWGAMSVGFMEWVRSSHRRAQA